MFFYSADAVTLAQLVKGNPTSEVWNFLEQALGARCVLYAMISSGFATRYCCRFV